MPLPHEKPPLVLRVYRTIFPASSDWLPEYRSAIAWLSAEVTLEAELEASLMAMRGGVSTTELCSVDATASRQITAEELGCNSALVVTSGGWSDSTRPASGPIATVELREVGRSEAGWRLAIDRDGKERRSLEALLRMLCAFHAVKQYSGMDLLDMIEPLEEFAQVWLCSGPRDKSSGQLALDDADREFLSQAKGVAAVLHFGTDDRLAATRRSVNELQSLAPGADLRYFLPAEHRSDLDGATLPVDMLVAL
jgi:hypothetical protein